jgi:multiple sugar transport system substrate-binding protein
MIPSTVEGKNLEYAVKFLQFVSAPEHIEPWLATSGGIPVLAGVEPAANVAGFLDGDWAKPFKVGYGILQTPSTTTNNNAFGGYLLGSKDLAQQTTELQSLYNERVAEDARNHPEWSGEDWFTG